MSNHAYTVELGKIAAGVPFMMVNYNGVYIRVEADSEYKICREDALSDKSEYNFNDDGFHVPIVELATGRLFYMAKTKPCLVYPGENYRRK